jgi:prephenate dehydrogenase
VVAVVGLGLVGGSLARALSRAGYRVIGVDRAGVARRAKAARAVAAAFSDLGGAAAAADVIVLAAPPAANRMLLRRLTRFPRLVVTDVGSVKGPIVREARRLGQGRFVGGHPIAGSERAGFAASRADLFRGHSWALVPGGDPRAFAIVRALVRATGARPVTMSAAEHDRALAYLSHVPQLASWALLAAARADAVAARRLRLAGPGFRDMTRLARSPRPLWREILAENRPEVARALRRLRRALVMPARPARRRRTVFAG